MDQVIIALTACLANIRRLGDEWLADGLQPQDPPLDALNRAANRATLALEVINFYAAVWRNAGVRRHPNAVAVEAARLVEQLRDENRQRVQDVLRDLLFVPMLSAMEWSAQLLVERFPDGLGPPSGATYKFSGIVSEAAKAGLLDDPSEERWLALVAQRNDIVHRNGVAASKLDVAFPNGAHIATVQGEPTQGDLMHFVRLTDWMIGDFERWAKEWRAR